MESETSALRACPNPVDVGPRRREAARGRQRRVQRRTAHAAPFEGERAERDRDCEKGSYRRSCRFGEHDVHRVVRDELNGNGPNGCRPRRPDRPRRRDGNGEREGAKGSPVSSGVVQRPHERW